MLITKLAWYLLHMKIDNEAVASTFTITFILSSLIINFFKRLFNHRRYGPTGAKSDDDDDDDDDGFF